MQIIFKRRLTNEVLTTYLPTALLILIGYCTTFFKPFFFEAALTVNLTVMLVLTTLFLSVINKLESTSYIKWIEFWLIFAQLLPFSEVILLTIQELYNDEDIEEINHQQKLRLNSAARGKSNLWALKRNGKVSAYSHV